MAGEGGDDEVMAAEWAEVSDDDADDAAPKAKTDTDSMADDWADMLGAETGDGAAGGGDGIPGLPDIDDGEAPTGLVSLINTNEVTYERLPMLEVIFDRLERMLTTSVRNFTAENVDINLDDISAQRFGDYLNAVQLPAMMAVFKAVEWDNYGLLTIDSAMIYSIVDVLLGGRRGTVPMRIEGRPYTTIEASLVERLVRLILQDLSNAFAPITPVNFRFERIETNPRFAAIARPGNACVVFTMRIDMQDRGGGIEFLFPYATLEPARDLLLQMFMGEKFGRDSIWESHLAREIWVTDVDLEALLDEHSVTLREIMELEVGSVLPLNTRADSRIILRCGDVPMLTGKIGRIGDNLAVEVEDRLNAEME